MPEGTLRELYHAELTDLYSVEQQIVAALPTMASRAASEHLRAALEQHLERTRVHIERLELLFNKFGLPKSEYRSTAMEALIRDGERRINQMSGPDVRDAAVIAAAQHVEHYEIAGYGCARTYARQLGDDDAADLLQQTLDEEGSADKQLTDIAETINQAAAPEEDADAARRRSRLRYVDLDDLDGDRHEYRDYKIRNASGEDIGSVDGFIVDASGRPYYVVVDSGGLFVGRRYIVPIGKARLDRSARAFTVSLDKDVLKRYPEFHRDAFIAMSDEEARRYEWRVLEALDPAAARNAPRAWDYEQFDFYRRPEWADEQWTRSIPSGRRTRPERSATAAGATSDRDRSSFAPDRDRDLVVASEEIIVTANNPEFDSTRTRDASRERITGTQRDDEKERSE